MSKTVNSSITITRDGVATSTQLKDMPYAKFVALQTSLAAALGLGQLCTWGALRVAAMVDPTQKSKSSAGDSDLRFELRTDHGKGGSEFVVGYSGISAQDADEITAIVKGAANAVLLP